MTLTKDQLAEARAFTRGFPGRFYVDDDGDIVFLARDCESKRCDHTEDDCAPLLRDIDEWEVYVTDALNLVPALLARVEELEGDPYFQRYVEASQAIERLTTDRDRLAGEVERLREASGLSIRRQSILAEAAHSLDVAGVPQDAPLPMRVDALAKERDSLAAQLAESQREADRWRHGKQIEGDYVCPAELERDAARKDAEQALTFLKQEEAWANDLTADRDRLRALLVEALGIADKWASFGASHDGSTYVDARISLDRLATIRAAQEGK